MPAPARRSVARKSNQKAIPVKEAKAKVLDLIATGAKVAEAIEVVGRKVETYRDWQKNDPEFAAALREIRDARETAGASDGRPPVPDFPQFCEELGQPLQDHQYKLWDAIEGRVPRNIHPSMKFTQGTTWDPREGQHVAGRMIGNIPPGHAKTTTFSINYCTWLIHKNPNIRIIVVCKDLGLAKQILGAVKFRLTSPVYRDLHLRYAPDGGWKDPDSSWTQQEIYVQGKGDGEKDPTMQALGIGGRIYGARSDVIILDDAVTLANVNEYEKQARWLDQEVESRLDGAGLLALLGTRIAPTDLYSHVREIEDADDEKVYTYFSMPAVLDEGDGNPENWVTLWPERFPGKRLRKQRRNEAMWALVYQQQDVSEDATFNAKAVEASINSLRFPGLLTDGGMGHRQGGMSGLYVVGGLDPATVGHTSMQVWGIDRMTQKRYVLDGFNMRGCSPQLMKDTVKRFTQMYGIHEWVIERNAFQRFLTQDEDLLQFLRAHGCKLTEHYTTANKYDADFGVQSMAQLFLTCGHPQTNNAGGKWERTPEKALIELPNPKQNAWVSEWINQMVVWQPSGMKQQTKTDLVMAGWFCEIAASRILGRRRDLPQHMHNPFLSKARAKGRTVVDLQAFREAAMAEREAA